MNLPIVAYGSPILRTVCEDITAEYAGLEKLIENMWETMYNSNGVGIAAPQIGKGIRLFIIDSEQIFENQEEDILQKQEVTISFQDENFKKYTKTFNGITARVILHEYDHIDGKLFIDYLKPLKRTLLKRKLDDISKGKVKTDYRMSFAK